MRYRTTFLITVLGLMLAGVTVAQDKGKVASKVDTETVVTTFHVKEGKEDEFAKVLEQAWATYQRLGMVLPKFNLVLRGVEGVNKTYFMEIFTWKDHDAPDHAPAEVQTIWARMESLCERRDGHRGIEFTEVQIIAPPK